MCKNAQLHISACTRTRTRTRAPRTADNRDLRVREREAVLCCPHFFALMTRIRRGLAGDALSGAPQTHTDRQFRVQSQSQLQSQQLLRAECRPAG